MDMDSLTEVALQNARNAAPDMRIIKREYRNVNGVRAIYMEMRGTTQGADFTFSGYYFSNDSGTTQFLTYTGTNLLGMYDAEIRSFLNGFSKR